MDVNGPQYILEAASYIVQYPYYSDSSMSPVMPLDMSYRSVMPYIYTMSPSMTLEEVKAYAELLTANGQNEEALQFCAEPSWRHRILGDNENFKSYFRYYIATMLEIAQDKLGSFQVCRDALRKYLPIKLVPEFRRIMKRSWEKCVKDENTAEMVADCNPGFYFSLDDPEFFEYTNKEILTPAERFIDFKASTGKPSAEELLGNEFSRD
jgi:hypothetical protein